MGVQFACTGCGQQYSVAETLARKRVRCKKCGQAMAVPASQAAPQDELEGLLGAGTAGPSVFAPPSPGSSLGPAALGPAALGSAPGPKRKARSKRRVPLWAWIGGGVSLAVIVLVWLAASALYRTVAGPPIPSWSAQPDPGPTRLAPLAVSRIELDGDVNAVAFFSHPDAARMLVAEESSGRPIKFRRYDLKSGELLDSLTHPTNAEDLDVLDFSPDGTRVAVGQFGQFGWSDTVSVWSLAGGRVEPVLQLPESQWRSFAAFVDDDRLLTVNESDDQLILWRLPEATQVYSTDIEGDIHLLSPGRKYLVVESRISNFTTDRRLMFYETATGECCGSLEDMEPRPSDLECAAFSPDGKRFAALFDFSRNGYDIAWWDVSTGKLLGRTGAEPLVTMNSPQGVWTRDGWCVLGSLLVDVDRSRVAWKYSRLTPVRGPTPDGRVWFVRDGDRDRPTTIDAATLPGDRLLEQMAQAGAQGPAIEPGPVSLTVQLEADPPEAGFEQRVAAALGTSLARIGVRVEPGQPRRVVARIWEEDSGRVQQARERFADSNSPTIEIPDRSIEITLVFVDADGRQKKLASDDFDSTLLPVLGQRVSGDPVEYLLNRRWTRLLKWAEELRLPGAAGAASKPLGSSAWPEADAEAQRN